MNLEGIALYALTDYLKREITGSRIYKIGMPSAHVVYFSLRREYDTIHLIMDVNGGSPSVRIAAAAPGNPQEPPAFCMLLRKHLEEGKITQVRQYGLDRVIELEISLLGRTGRIIIKQIIIELTGKNANLVFAEDGKILDSIKHINPLMNSVRVIQPGYAYNPPPPQAGLNILTAVPEEIVAAIPDEVTGSLWKQLVNVTTGIGKASALQLLSAARIPLSATYLTPMDRNHLVSAITDLQANVTASQFTRGESVKNVRSEHAQRAFFDKTRRFETIRYARAWSMSAMRSEASSRPQEKRTMSAGTPAAASSSSFICRCVDDAGCRQQVAASATCVAMCATFRPFMNFSAASRPPFTPKLTTPHVPPGMYFRASSW